MDLPDDEYFDLIFTSTLQEIHIKYLPKDNSYLPSKLFVFNKDTVRCYVFKINSAISIVPNINNQILLYIDYERIKNKNCWVCGCFEKCQMCANCKLVKYCSKECQLIAWKEYHKNTCKNLLNNII